jgi:hypothetical protein
MAAGAVLVLAACTSPSHSRHPSGTPTRGSGSTATAPTSASPTTYVPPAGLFRTPFETEIGDPAAADLCSAIRLSALVPSLGAGRTASFDARQFPPGCSVTVRDGTDAVLELSVFARRGPSRTTGVHHSREVSGHTILTFAYDAKTGSCRRVVVASGVRLVVDAFPSGSEIPDRSVSCAATDALADQVAGAVGGGTIDRLPSASPEFGTLYACAVAEQAGISSLPAFAGGRFTSRGFGANCELAAQDGKRFLFINIEIAKTARPQGATRVLVDGHRVYEISSQPSYCAYTALQAGTTDGRYERLAVSSTDVGSQQPPSELCAQTARALAQYLTAAGLG